MTEAKAETQKMEELTFPTSHISELPLMPNPDQIRMFEEWWAGIRAGSGFVDQRRHLAQGGYSTAARMFCMLLTRATDLPKDFRLRIIMCGSKRTFSIWIDNAFDLCRDAGKGAWTAQSAFRATPKGSTWATLTLTHTETKRSLEVSLETPTNAEGAPVTTSGGAFLKTDYLIFEDCFFNDAEVEGIRKLATENKDFPACAVATRCRCNLFYSATEARLCKYHLAIHTAEKQKEEAEMKRTGRKCVCSCARCFPDQEFPDPEWQCMCSRCPKPQFWPYSAVRVGGGGAATS